MRAVTMLLGSLLVVGCAGSTGEVGGSADDAMSGDVAATVEVKVQGETARFLLHVTNTGSRALDFTFRSSQRFDFVVRDDAGSEVWRWSDGMMFLQALSEASLAPRETWDFDVTWDPGDRSGRFQVVGWVTASEHDVQQSATFELP
ncbi:MAG TPA: BsuPI-related putative proteinase inhibitor [Longimicrobiales bacterium]|nr:BsuPI-related putative proteinase inhibitor [Longimicrobiales bacterium]